MIEISTPNITNGQRYGEHTVKTCKCTSPKIQKVLFMHRRQGTKGLSACGLDLKKFRLNWWINFFSGITKISLFKPHLSSHQECLLFCFLPIIQAELNEVVQTWNLRHVRQSASAPGGKPDVLFHVPETIGFEAKRISVSDSDLNIVNHVLGMQHHLVYQNIDLHNLLNCCVHLNEITIPRSAEEALAMYVSLLRCLSNDSFEV